MPFNMVKSFAIKGNKTILVDTGVPGSSKNILRELGKNGINKKDISLIVLTHSHSDHSGSAKELRELLDVPIAAHKAEVSDIEQGIKRPYSPTSFAGKIWKYMPPATASYDPVKVDIVIEDETSLENFGVDAGIIHTPGHTPGSISVVVQNKTVIAGDLLAGGIIIGGIAKQSKPMLPPFQEDIPETKKSLEKVLALNPETIHVCHGGPLDIRLIEKMLNEYSWN